MAHNENFIRTRWFEDIPIGEFHVFGSHTFSEQEMIEFGTLYAPQIIIPTLNRLLRPVIGG